MSKKVASLVLLLLLGALTVLPAYAGRGDGPVIFVESTGLYYDSIVTAKSLPMHGDFQKLEPGGESGLMTAFGPGDQEYRGGRWWLDDGDGIMGEEDMFFSCPLLGPGRLDP